MLIRIILAPSNIITKSALFGSSFPSILPILSDAPNITQATPKRRKKEVRFFCDSSSEEVANKAKYSYRAMNGTIMKPITNNRFETVKFLLGFEIRAVMIFSFLIKKLFSSIVS